MPLVLVPLADGFEEVEAVTIIDLLRRAGIEVIVASLRGESVRGNHGITLNVECELDKALERDFDLVVLPGGQPGSDNLEADPRIRDLLQAMVASGRFVAAICAAPKVLKAAGVLDGRRATSFPGVLDVSPAEGMEFTMETVVEDGKVITSRGPGTAMDFGLHLIGALLGSEARRKVEERLQRPEQK